MCIVYILLRFEDGYLFQIEKEVYNSDFEADELIRKHGNIVRFQDRKSTRLNSSHTDSSRMPSSA